MAFVTKFRNEGFRFHGSLGGQRLGTISSASLIEAFVRWVGRETAADSIDILLCAGNTDHLQRMVGAVTSGLTRLMYLPVDSMSVMLADTDVLTIVDRLQSVVAVAQGRSVCEMFRQMEVPLPGKKVMRDIGLHDDTIVEVSTRHLFARLLHACRWEIFKVCRRRRRELFDHFLKSGVMDGMRIGIVTLGWNPDIEIAVGRALDAMFELDVYSYCFCLKDNAAGVAMRSALRARAMISADTHSGEEVERIYAQRTTIDEWVWRRAFE